MTLGSVCWLQGWRAISRRCVSISSAAVVPRSPLRTRNTVVSQNTKRPAARPGKTRDAHVTGWTKAEQSIVWAVRLNRPAEYEVEITYDADDSAAGAAFQLSFGSQALKGTVKPGAIQTTALGRVSLKPGATEIKLSSSENRETELMRPRLVTLKVCDASLTMPPKALVTSTL